MEDHKIPLLGDYHAQIDVKHTRAEILDLSSDEDVSSAKIDKSTSSDGIQNIQIKVEPLKQEAIDLTIDDEDFSLDVRKPTMKQESIDLTGSDSESDDDDASLICRNLFMSQNSDEPSSASSPTAVDVSHLFDFSSANNVPGPAYIDEDEDNDRDLPVIFRSLSPLRSPLPCTPNHRTEGYSLRPRPRPSRNDTPTYSEPPAKRCKNHGNGEENPGWKKAYNWLLKKHGDLQQEYSMLKEKIEMAKRVEQGQGQGASRSPSHLSDVTNRGATVLGGTGHMNQRPYVSNVYSLLS